VRPNAPSQPSASCLAAPPDPAATPTPRSTAFIAMRFRNGPAITSLTMICERFGSCRPAGPRTGARRDDGLSDEEPDDTPPHPDQLRRDPRSDVRHGRSELLLVPPDRATGRRGRDQDRPRPLCQRAIDGELDEYDRPLHASMRWPKPCRTAAGRRCHRRQSRAVLRGLLKAYESAITTEKIAGIMPSPNFSTNTFRPRI
jgi:hypothetical protein